MGDIMKHEEEDQQAFFARLRVLLEAPESC